MDSVGHRIRIRRRRRRRFSICLLLRQGGGWRRRFEQKASPADGSQGILHSGPPRPRDGDGKRVSAVCSVILRPRRAAERKYIRTSIRMTCARESNGTKSQLAALSGWILHEIPSFRYSDHHGIFKILRGDHNGGDRLWRREGRIQ